MARERSREASVSFNRSLLLGSRRSPETKREPVEITGSSSNPPLEAFQVSCSAFPVGRRPAAPALAMEVDAEPSTTRSSRRDFKASWTAFAQRMRCRGSGSLGLPPPRPTGRQGRRFWGLDGGLGGRDGAAWAGDAARDATSGLDGGPAGTASEPAAGRRRRHATSLRAAFLPAPVPRPTRRRLHEEGSGGASARTPPREATFLLPRRSLRPIPLPASPRPPHCAGLATRPTRPNHRSRSPHGVDARPELCRPRSPRIH